MEYSQKPTEALLFGILHYINQIALFIVKSIAKGIKVEVLSVCKSSIENILFDILIVVGRLDCYYPIISWWLTIGTLPQYYLEIYYNYCSSLTF